MGDVRASLALRSPLYYPLGYTPGHQVDSQSTETGVGLSILIQEFAKLVIVSVGEYQIIHLFGMMLMRVVASMISVTSNTTATTLYAVG
jgi:hypothetical protein